MLTKASIDSELKMCELDSSYAPAIAPWVPIKCYYYIYYLESVFLYFICGDMGGFGPQGHHDVRASMLKKIELGEINILTKTKTNLNEITIYKTAKKFRTKSGRNISGDYYSKIDCGNSIRKKIADYIEIDWKKRKGIKNLKEQKARLIKDDLYLKKFLLTDFYYWMRIKVNYQDADFLNFEQDTDPIDSYEYVKEYIESTEKYAKALLLETNNLKIKRGII